MRFKMMLAALAVTTTAACATLDPVSGSEDPGFGEALKFDMAIQTINPDPVYDDKGARPGDSAAKGAEAYKRYRTDRVKDAKPVITSSGSGGPR